MRTTTAHRPDTRRAERVSSESQDLEPRRTRISGTFASTAVGLVVLALTLVFVLQNDANSDYELLWADFTLPSGVAMLFAAISGGLVVAMLGLARVLQLRLQARRHRDAHTS